MAEFSYAVAFNPLDLLQNVDGCFIVFEVDSNKIIFTNASTCEILQYNFNQLIQMSFIDLFAPLNRKEILNFLECANQIQSQYKGSFDIPYQKKNGESYKAHSNITQGFFHGKRVFLVFCQDLANKDFLKKQLEEQEKLHNETKQYQETLEELIMRKAQELHIEEKIINQSLDGICVFDLNRTILFANQSYCQMHLFKKEEVIGSNISIMHNKEQMYTEFNAHLEHTLRTGSYVGEIGHFRKDETIFPAWTSLVVLKNDKNESIGIVEFIQDITDKKRTENALIKERNFLNNIITLNPYAIAIFDSKGYFVRANQACVELFGYSPPSTFNLFEHPYLVKSGFQEEFLAIKNGFLLRFDNQSINLRDIAAELPDKTIKFRIVGFPIFDSTGKFENLIVIFENLNR